MFFIINYRFVALGDILNFLEMLTRQELLPVVKPVTCHTLYLTSLKNMPHVGIILQAGFFITWSVEFESGKLQ